MIGLLTNTRAWKYKSFYIKVSISMYTLNVIIKALIHGNLQINYHLERQNYFIMLSGTLVDVLDACFLVETCATKRTIFISIYLFNNILKTICLKTILIYK